MLKSDLDHALGKFMKCCFLDEPILLVHVEKNLVSFIYGQKIL